MHKIIISFVIFIGVTDACYKFVHVPTIGDSLNDVKKSPKPPAFENPMSKQLDDSDMGGYKPSGYGMGLSMGAFLRRFELRCQVFHFNQFDPAQLPMKKIDVINDDITYNPFGEDNVDKQKTQQVDAIDYQEYNKIMDNYCQNKCPEFHMINDIPYSKALKRQYTRDKSNMILISTLKNVIYKIGTRNYDSIYGSIGEIYRGAGKRIYYNSVIYGWPIVYYSFSKEEMNQMVRIYCTTNGFNPKMCEAYSKIDPRDYKSQRQLAEIILRDKYYGVYQDESSMSDCPIDFVKIASQSYENRHFSPNECVAKEFKKFGEKNVVYSLFK